MSLRHTLQRLAQPVEVADQKSLASWCDKLGATPMDSLQLRRPQTVAGEVKAIRMVPKAGSDSLEVVLTDGRGSVTGIFLGRETVAGIAPGTRLAFEGLLMRTDGRWEILNPSYTLL